MNSKIVDLQRAVHRSSRDNVERRSQDKVEDMSESVSITEDCRWFVELVQYVPDFVAHINNIPYPDQLVALVTYCLQEAVKMEDDHTPGFIRKNEKKYDTRVVLSYWDPTTGTGWAPDIQLAGDAYADFMEFDFRRVNFTNG